MAHTNLREKVRLNLEIHPDVKARLDDLQERTQAASLTEVIRRSLALYNLVVDLQQEGGRITLHRKDGTAETLAVL